MILYPTSLRFRVVQAIVLTCEDGRARPPDWLQ